MTPALLDYLIIGAGPAGLQLAALLEREHRDYLVLEAGPTPGTFFRTYPRHRTLISINKPHTGSDDPELNLRMDWNSLLSDDPELRFTRYSERYFPDADDLVRYLADFAVASKARVRYDTRVTRVGRGPAVEAGAAAGEGAVFEVSDEAGETFRSRRLIVATGLSRLNHPRFEGSEQVEGYDQVTVDPKDFLDQRVLILGKGNSAFETADNLIETAAVIHVAGAGSIQFAWRTHYVGHLRAVNNNFLDTYQLKSQNAILDGTVRRIERRGGQYLVTFSFSRVNEITKDLLYDRVIACTGFRFDPSIFAEDCRPALVIDDRFPEQTSAWESVNVPDLYIAGTLSQQRDFKKSTSGFIHGFRYGVRALERILGQRYHGAGWPATELAPTPEAIAAAVIARVNRTSALWQQFGVLADVVTTGPAPARDGGPARYHEEVPTAYFRDGGLGRAAHAFAVTLEYGPEHDQVDPFDINVSRIAQDHVGQAHDAAYLHPVVRYYRAGVPAGTHHLAENLENQWDRPAIHRDPLIGFLARCLDGVLDGAPDGGRATEGN